MSADGWTADEAVDYLVVAAVRWAAKPTAIASAECGRVITAELARLRRVEAAARAIDREGGDLPHLNDALSAALSGAP
jgi:hypothetical protein